MLQILYNILSMASQSIWKKQSQILQQNAISISTLKKQINKQAEIDANVQMSIDQKIENLKKDACSLANKLQNEKHKNQELQVIINHMKNQMECEKVQEASRDNINFQNLASLENKLKKLEYDLVQANIKTNRLSQNVEKKKSVINQNRTERVIDSGIFTNIEKELFQSQLKFKKLLLEKVRHQKEYQKKLQQYQQLKEKAQKYAHRDIQKIKLVHQVSQSCQKNQGAKPKTDLNKFKKMQFFRQAKGRCPTIKNSDERNFQELNYIVCIKKIISQTGLENCKELLFSFQNADQINEKYFNEINKYINQTDQIERYLAENKIPNNMKQNKSLDKEIGKNNIRAKRSREKKEHIEQNNELIQKDLAILATFFKSQNFKKFVKELDVQLPLQQGEKNFNHQALIQTFQLLQNNIQQFLKKENIQQPNHVTKSSNNENLQFMISQVKKNEERLKIMKKQDFQEQYHKIAKNLSQKSMGARQVIKKKSFQQKK